MNNNNRLVNEQLSYQEADVLRVLFERGGATQRIIADVCGHSVGMINRCIRELERKGYITGDNHLSRKGVELIKEKSPRNAIILAAGAGMRMTPINFTTPKALLEVRGERLIERLIDQLHEAGITDITIVAGFMQEEFEYLMDEEGVELVVNEDYFVKNNLHSLSLAADKINNTYILPCDIWCRENPFKKRELYSWYMLSDRKDIDGHVRVNRKGEVVKTQPDEPGNRMIGISYLTGPQAERVTDKLKKLSSEKKYEGAFWEEALYERDHMIVNARIIKDSNIEEINTYEQLREIDSNSNHLKSNAIETIMGVFDCSAEDIVDICVLKKGMTNRSFLFSVSGEKYIMRIPGEGTEQLINRYQEAAVYDAIRGRGLCDDPVYICAENGYKITKFLEGIRACDPLNEDDVRRCMNRLKQFHEMELKVEHTFDLFGQIQFYEKLWNGKTSVYRDYKETKEHVLELKSYIEKTMNRQCLTHIDAVSDNFLFYKNENGEELLQLTDWEYAGMQDPHVDIAMFCIYALYKKEKVDRLIDIYFDNCCDKDTRAKIYCYIASCGLLWSNWCEYKRQLGIEFGEYSLRQYRYAKDYYRYAKQLMAE